jgi:hypothetical protein
MPPLSSHFRFATLVMYQLRIKHREGAFLLGTTAPDAFDLDSEESFSQHHFRAMDGRISLEGFLKQTHFVSKSSNNSSWSFSCGYYAHLWLDVFYRDNVDRMPFKGPFDMENADFRKLVRRETEILNAPFVLNASNLKIPRFENLSLPGGLEFIDLERCKRLFQEVLKQSETWSQLTPTSDTVDAAEYAAFFAEVSKLFLSDFKYAA